MAMREIPSLCPRDGSPLVLDLVHLAAAAPGRRPIPTGQLLEAYASGAWLPAVPVVWRCVASGHTILDRDPDPTLSVAHLARIQNGLKRRGKRCKGTPR